MKQLLRLWVRVYERKCVCLPGRWPLPYLILCTPSPCLSHTCSMSRLPPSHSFCPLQANLVKQLGKLVKVRYVEDITPAKRVGECVTGIRSEITE